MTKDTPIEEAETGNPQDSGAAISQPDNNTLHDFDEPLIYQTVSEQIGAEERQIEKRMGWTLTFNGLLFAAFALISKDTIDPMIKQSLEIAIPTVGGISALLGFIGIYAAYSQIEVQINYWKDRVEVRSVLKDLPNIFGSGSIHTRGKYPAYGNPIVLMLVWLAILVAVLYEGCLSNGANSSNSGTQIEAVAGNIEPATPANTHSEKPGSESADKMIYQKLENEGT